MARAKSKAAGKSASGVRGKSPNKGAGKTVPPTVGKTSGKAPTKAKGQSLKHSVDKPSQGSDKASAPPTVDTRKVPLSPRTLRAEGAATRVLSLLKDARKASLGVRKSAAEAQKKAKQSGAVVDKAAVQKARAKVDRAAQKVANLRSAARAAQARVMELKADDRYKAKTNAIAVRLRQADMTANQRIEQKLERAVDKYRTTKHAELTRAELKKAKQRKRKADRALTGLMREKSEKVAEARRLLASKPPTERGATS